MAPALGPEAFLGTGEFGVLNLETADEANVDESPGRGAKETLDVVVLHRQVYYVPHLSPPTNCYRILYGPLRG